MTSAGLLARIQYLVVRFATHVKDVGSGATRHSDALMLARKKHLVELNDIAAESPTRVLSVHDVPETTVVHNIDKGEAFLFQ